MSEQDHRRCPRCRRVFEADELARVDYGGRWRHHGEGWRECPKCGYVGPTSAFAAVEEQDVQPSRAEVAT